MPANAAPRTPPKAPAAIAAAVLIAAPLTAAFEGYVAKAKPDPVGIMTGCYGERVDMSDLDPNKVYSKTECGARLRKRLAEQYAPPVVACVPGLANPIRKYVLAAFIDAAWNAGPKNVCASPMALAANAHDDWAACLGFLGWKVAPKGKYLAGLLLRREAETRMCFGRPAGLS